MKRKDIESDRELWLAIVDAAIEANDLFVSLPGDEDDKRELWSHAAELADDPMYTDYIDEEPEDEAKERARRERVQRLSKQQERIELELKRTSDRLGVHAWEDVESWYSDAFNLETKDMPKLRSALLATYDAALRLRAALDQLRKKWGPDFDDEGVEGFIWDQATELVPAKARKLQELEHQKWDLVIEAQEVIAGARKASGQFWDDYDLESRLSELTVGE